MCFFAIGLFSHAEVGKDVVEDVFGGDFAACDFAEVMEASSEVFGHKVSWGLVGKGFLGTTEGFECLFEGVVVTDICHDGMRVVEVGGQGNFLYQSIPQEVQAVSIGRRNMEQTAVRLTMIEVGTAG